MLVREGVWVSGVLEGMAWRESVDTCRYMREGCAGRYASAFGCKKVSGCGCVLDIDDMLERECGSSGHSNCVVCCTGICVFVSGTNPNSHESFFIVCK